MATRTPTSAASSQPAQAEPSAPVPAPIAAPAGPLALLREVPAFLKRPAILKPMGLGARAGWAALGVLSGLHVAVLLLVVLPLIGLWQQAMHLPAPDAFDTLPAGWLLPITVLIAPIAEETVFRGWQSGRPRALWLLLCGVLFAGLAVSARALAPLALLGTLVALALAALGGWLVLRRRQPAAVCRAAFPMIFWIAALVFAAVHLMNYPSVSAAMLPMVLPQLWAGLMLGFTRQRIGLPAAMLQHMAANAATMVLVQLGG